MELSRSSRHSPHKRGRPSFLRPFQRVSAVHHRRGAALISGEYGLGSHGHTQLWLSDGAPIPAIHQPAKFVPTAQSPVYVTALLRTPPPPKIFWSGAPRRRKSGQKPVTLNRQIVTPRPDGRIRQSAGGRAGVGVQRFTMLKIGICSSLSRSLVHDPCRREVPRQSQQDRFSKNALRFLTTPTPGQARTPAAVGCSGSNSFTDKAESQGGADNDPA